jgi:hypothetical protein
MKRTAREEGYQFVRWAGKGFAVFMGIGGSQPELYQANKGHCSWGFRWHGTDWEFVSSRFTLDQPSAS